MIDRLKARLGSEQGFTLIELLVVIIILGILLAIAVPSYLSFKDRANKTAAQSDLRSLVPSVESYSADNIGTATDVDSSATTSGYQGMTVTLLHDNYDQSINDDGSIVINPTGFTGSKTDYCLTKSVNGWTAFKHGPAGTIGVTQNFDAATCAESTS